MNFLTAYLEKVTHIERADKKVEEIKHDTENKIIQTTAILEKVGKLQKVVMKKTTTYYLAKAVGALP